MIDSLCNTLYPSVVPGSKCFRKLYERLLMVGIWFWFYAEPMATWGYYSTLDLNSQNSFLQGSRLALYRVLGSVLRFSGFSFARCTGATVD
jgi:hypothetical protein